jgi:SAM-dependent methyltransferase
MTESQSRARELRDRYESGDRTAIQAIKEEAGKYHFYHNIEIVPGVLTQGQAWADEYVNRVIAVMKRFDFKGKRVLDIGCRDGAQSFAAEQLGASEVVGIDNDLSNGLVEFLIPFKQSRVKAYQCNLNDLSREQFGEFDTVIFPGVLYHLRYPFWGLRRIADVLKPSGVLIIESGFIEGFADLPILFCPIGTDSPYEPTSITYFNEAGIADTLVSIGFSDIRQHDSFCYGFTEAQEREYLADKFPKFLRVYAGHHKLSVCRKIFSCVKAWSTDDKRIDPAAMHLSQAQILQRYWDGIHGLHTRWAIDHDEAG